MSFIATGRKVAEKKNVFVFWQFIATCTQFFDWNTIVIVAFEWVLGEFGIATKVNEEGFVIVETFNGFQKFMKCARPSNSLPITLPFTSKLSTAEENGGA